jgi:hypothetical protein
MRLYKVRVEFETVILANSQKEAEQMSEYVIRRGDDPPERVDLEEITSSEDLPEGWDENCRPWGIRDSMDRTIGQILLVKTDGQS